MNGEDLHKISQECFVVYTYSRFLYLILNESESLRILHICSIVYLTFQSFYHEDELTLDTILRTCMLCMHGIG